MSSVTGPSEVEPVEPAESVEPEPGIPFVVESEVYPGEPEVVFGHFYPADPNAGEEYVVVVVVMSLSKASLS